ncbi:hypothetical protein DFQ26_004676 [Actinomortierella ambigua]|nr:hypothetical protein DFQ26_004676 [Actinomortierella ambigua]
MMQSVVGAACEGKEARRRGAVTPDPSLTEEERLDAFFNLSRRTAWDLRNRRNLRRPSVAKNNPPDDEAVLPIDDPTPPSATGLAPFEEPASACLPDIVANGPPVPEDMRENTLPAWPWDTADDEPPFDDKFMDLKDEMDIDLKLRIMYFESMDVHSHLYY